MEKKFNTDIDSQYIAECVGFLDDCFDVSFTLQNTLMVVKDFAAEELEKQMSQSLDTYKGTKVVALHEKSKLESSAYIVSEKNVSENTSMLSTKLADWGLPTEIVLKYESRGVKEMFDWQVSCLGNSKVLMDCCNLVYSAPTSAGKTLVAEILTIKTVLERQKKVIIILPFVSIVREKMVYLQDILSSSGIRVEGFMGSQSPPGGFQAIHVAICTIEKANSLVNKLLDEGNISELGAVVVDELHLLGDAHRGYILELLLTKIKYISSGFNGINIQIIGMSATLPNLEILSKWLNAELYITQFRPIKLEEYCLVGNQFFDVSGGPVKSLDVTVSPTNDNILQICYNTLQDGCSVLIFCMTKNWCENLAQTISSSFYKIGSSGNELGETLRNQLKSEGISEVLEQLKSCPVGLDQVLKKTVSFGVAYHHAGLTFDERDIIEGAFKTGAIRVLVATSTLSSGVNLPARRVIIRSPIFQRQPINILTYKQMAGRAGRMGRDVMGESIITCTEAEKKIAFELMNGSLDPVTSCILHEDKFMRAVLEVIASSVASTKTELNLYTSCTLMYNQQDQNHHDDNLLNKTLDELQNFELVRVQNDNEDVKYVATPLGKACLASSMAPNDGLSLFCELQKARQCLVLETDLHLIYLVTPYSVSSQWGNIDWLHLLTLWESLTKAMKRVGDLVGIQENFIIRCVRNASTVSNTQNKMHVHKRFYTALALQDLVNEVPLSEVANKFQCPRGFLQSLQQAAATFAGMVTAFCHQLGWKNMEMLFSQFQDRLHFGIHSELLELMRLSSLNGMRARSLFNSGFETVTSIAIGDINCIENALHSVVPFQSEREREDGDVDDAKKRNKIKNIWVTGYCGLTTRQAAENLIVEARQLLEQEIGVDEIKWNNELLLNHGKIKIESKTKKCKMKIVKNKIIDSSKVDTINNSINSEKHLKLTFCNDNKVNSKISMDIQVNNLQDDIHNNMNEANIHVHEKSKYEVEIELKENNRTEAESNLTKDAEFFNSSLGLNISNNKTILNNKEILATDKKSNVSENMEWDSVNFSEIVFNNISKLRTSDQVWSPNSTTNNELLHLGDTITLCKNIECVNGYSNLSNKDVILFSSDDGNNSSLFEDSLPLDSIPSKLFDINYHNKNELSMDMKNCDVPTKNRCTNDNINLNMCVLDDDENITLFYDEESDHSDQKANCSKNDDEIMSSQDIDYSNDKTRSKKMKLEKPLQFCGMKNKLPIPTMKCSKSKQFTLNILKYNVTCYHLSDSDVITFLNSLKTVKSIALFIPNNEGTLPSTVIGRNVLRKGDLQILAENNSLKFIQGVAILYTHDFCTYLDMNISDEKKTLALSALTNLFKQSGIHVKVMSSKDMSLKLRKCFGLEMPSNCTDLSLTEWLLDNDEKVPSIEYLVGKYLEMDLSKSFVVRNNKKLLYKSFTPIELSCIKVWAIWNISLEQSKAIGCQCPSMKGLLDTEIHVAKILSECEFYGIAVDRKLSSEFLTEVQNAQATLQTTSYKICGYHFNFSSSKEVAKVLGIYNGRRVSTKKSVLSSHNTPMASIIIMWRKLNAILSKTLYPLTAKAVIHSENNRIYPTYTMHTCSGRISMHEPNLQSVPRTFTVPLSYLSSENFQEKGDVIEFNCRNIFMAAPEYILVSADYCQLEMRILTHYCKDNILMNIMNSDMDVFTSIAASWGSVTEEEVDDDLRQKAKQLCYGIIYGMGSRTLGNILDVSEMEAAVFVDTFYKTYPAIKIFTQKVIEDCKKKGYIETLMKRRRYLPDINSKVLAKRNSAERQAINTTIQGSAADIAKAAMCAIDNKIKLQFGDSKPRLILQLHDELIYEVPVNSKDSFVKVLKYAMEKTVKLDVSLPVKMKVGYTWGSLQSIKT